MIINDLQNEIGVRFAIEITDATFSRSVESSEFWGAIANHTVHECDDFTYEILSPDTLEKAGPMRRRWCLRAAQDAAEWAVDRFFDQLKEQFNN